MAAQAPLVRLAPLAKVDPRVPRALEAKEARPVPRAQVAPVAAKTPVPT
jgi:hypothetical protein